MEINLRIEECRVDLLVAKECFRFQLLQFQPELELLELKVQVWAATHRGEEVITNDNSGQGADET